MFDSFVNAVEDSGFSGYRYRLANINAGARERHVTDTLDRVECIERLADGKRGVVRFHSNDGEHTFDICTGGKFWQICG